MISPKIFLVAFLALGAAAIPLAPTELATDAGSAISNSDIDPLESVSDLGGANLDSFDRLDKRCEWDDGHGKVGCDYFSVVIREEEVVIKGNGWEKVTELDCDHSWTSFYSPLKWTVDIRGGEACKPWPNNYDNTWIRYAGEHLDVPSDTRCGSVGRFNWSRRCIIPTKM